LILLWQKNDLHDLEKIKNQSLDIILKGNCCKLLDDGLDIIGLYAIINKLTNAHKTFRE